MSDLTASSSQPSVQQLAQAALQANQPTAWFEPLYAAAQGNDENVPWAYRQPHPQLIEWFTQTPQNWANCSAVVVGCGLGDDAEFLQASGLQVTAFDVSPTAIAWCQQRFPHSSVAYEVADLFDLSTQWQHHFDLVFECRTLQALPATVRESAIQAIAQLVRPGGQLCVITRYQETPSIVDGPPWPLSHEDLRQFQTQQLTEVSQHTFQSQNHPALNQKRIIYQHIAPSDSELTGSQALFSVQSSNIPTL